MADAVIGARLMRILLVNDLPAGSGAGTEIYVDRLAKGLIAAGDDVELFAGQVRHGRITRALDVWDPWARREVVERARRFGAEVVHHHNVLRELSVSVLGVPREIPSMLTVHDFRMLGVGDGQRARMERAKLAKGRFDRTIARSQVDVVVAVTQVMADRLEAAGFHDVAFVPAFAPHPPPDIDVVAVGDTQDVVFAGRLGEDKGVRVLAFAFSLVAGDHPSARLVVAGDGPLRPMLEGLSSRLGAGRVQLLGRLDERGVAMAMARARVVVTPSLPALRPEGSSLTVVEAAFLGRPVVVSDDPGTAAVVERSGAGLVVPAGSIVALAGALDRLLGDADLAAKMGAAGRAHALRHHTVHEGVARYRQLYARLISQRRSARQ